MKQTNTFSMVSKNSSVKRPMKLQANIFTSAFYILGGSGIEFPDKTECAPLDLKMK